MPKKLTHQKQQKEKVILAGVLTLLLVPMLLFTVFIVQQPQSIRQFALEQGKDLTAPGPHCGPDTILKEPEHPGQKAILEEVCAIDYSADICKDVCRRIEADPKECEPGGRFGPPPPPPPPPVVQQPAAPRNTGARRPAARRPAANRCTCSLVAPAPARILPPMITTPFKHIGGGGILGF